MKTETKGFVIVASRNSNFYIYATNLAESIKDFYPEVQITLVTEERFVDERADVADTIIHCDNHYRAKLWGMAQTPYDITMYVDADMDCEHEDIMTVWDNMKDYDMVFHELTKEREKFYTIRYFNYEGKREMYTLCGGVCLYRSSNPLVREFMEDWFELYNEQYSGRWRPEGFDKEQFNRDLRHFDQTTLWWLTEKEPKYKDLKIGFFDDDIRWNYFTQYQYENLVSKEDKPPILRHYSGSLKKDRLIV
jgi:hypothetical protein